MAFAGNPSAPEAESEQLVVAGRPAELVVVPLSEHTLRISLVPLEASGASEPVRDQPVIVSRDWPAPVMKVRSLPDEKQASWGDRVVRLLPEPLAVSVERRGGGAIQRLQIDREKAKVTFSLGDGPIFGLGHGGQQFDRRGAVYPMRNAHGAWHLETFGGRMPIPWLIGTEGWALFFHQPLGTFDLAGNDGRFEPWASEPPLPLDVFLVAADEPAQIMADYARLTGQPHLPALWALGYQQSHRTLASRDAVLSIARTFREKGLPCDVLIYLGTGWCPSGWNTGHGSFTFNPRSFPDPGEMLRELRENNFHVVLHAVRPPERLHGGPGDADAAAEDDSHAASYWAKHRQVLRLGVDGWWPDAGEGLSVDSRLARIRMYWEGPQIDRPNLRPYALHRTGYAGMQRYGWLWSGDVDSTWKTLEAQVPVGINTSLTGVPLWGTDTAGFVPTRELTGELYVRWFQFSAFCPLFRSHGRAWKLRLPWGWDTGELGPPEIEGYAKQAALPDTKELLNADVEPICRKYLELRYRLMPYLYSAAREAHESGMPIMRALWLHYNDDPRAVERSDEYLWGRDILVAPVTERGASSRRLYLPQGTWYDFWTEAKVEGGRAVTRPVDLATMPLYVRAGAILPFARLKQFTGEKPDNPLELVIYPGADGQFELYEDDGTTFDYLRGEWMGLRLVWDDRDRCLTLSLKEGSRMLPPVPRRFEVRIASEQVTRSADFEGRPVQVRF